MSVQADVIDSEWKIAKQESEQAAVAFNDAVANRLTSPHEAYNVSRAYSVAYARYLSLQHAKDVTVHGPVLDADAVTRAQLHIIRKDDPVFAHHVSVMMKPLVLSLQLII